MTRSQLTAIRILREGPALFEGRWVSPEDMRRDAAKADRFLAWYYR